MYCTCMCVHLCKTGKFSLHYDVSRKLAIAQTYTRTILSKFPKHSEHIKLYQGCCLRKITRGLEVPDHEILGDQHLSLNVKKMSFSRPKKQKLVASSTPGPGEHRPVHIWKLWKNSCAKPLIASLTRQHFTCICVKADGSMKPFSMFQDV